MTLSYNPYAFKGEQWKRTPRKKDLIKERNPNAFTFQNTSRSLSQLCLRALRFLPKSLLSLADSALVTLGLKEDGEMERDALQVGASLCQTGGLGTRIPGKKGKQGFYAIDTQGHND